MDTLRLLLFFALALVLLLIYQAWVDDYGPIGGSAPAVTEGAPQGGAIPQAGTTTGAEIPPADVAPVPAIDPATAAPGAVQVGTPSSRPITVETDVLRLEIAPLGGAIVSAWLKDYAQTADDPETKFRLLKPEPPNMFIAESGLRGPETGPLPADTGTILFQAAQDAYSLAPGQDSLEVVLTWSDPASGAQVNKRYRFSRGSYVVESVQEIVNGTGAPLAARSYSQLQRTELYDPDASSFIYTYTGGVYYTPQEKYTKVSFEDMRSERLSLETADGWIAMIQHYFLAAWLPPAGEVQTFFTSVREDSKYLIGSYTAAVTVPAGASHAFTERLFVGPKLQDTLASVAPGLELAVDYGWLTIIAQPIFWLLDAIHSLVGNWGWAIIILTILIKLAFYKLSETSYKSMANMRKLTPRLQALKDKYGDDKEKLNQAMMEMYKKEKINPLGGCLPILVQIPVFIALYWVLLESVELRQAPFALWIDNLSAPDPYFVLPLIMGVSMFVQQKLNPAPPDPIQAKIMMSLPFVFTVFFAFFPSGLVLYWVVNNLLSIAQQWHITRNIEKAAAKQKR
jgi:YidC/Oxa1 family membrane protein insertase